MEVLGPSSGSQDLDFSLGVCKGFRLFFLNVCKGSRLPFGCLGFRLVFILMI